MAKDPAFLFYPGDWNLGTMHMTILEKGAYIELLMLQFARGKFSEASAKHMLQSSFSEVWPAVSEKFKKDGEFYINERLDAEIKRRKKFTESRRSNGLIGKKVSETDEASAKHMLMHMEAATVNDTVLEIGSEKINEIANEVWKDQYWKESICQGLSITMPELKKWLALFNSSIGGDKIPSFDKSKYKKMSRGWISAQQSKGVVVDKVKKSDSAPLQIIQHGN